MKKKGPMQITVCIGLLVAAGLLIHDNLAFGLSYPDISLERAVQDSQVIVAGRVESLDAAKDLGKGFSLARVKVTKVIKNTTKESPIKVGDEVSIQVFADGAWGKVPYTKGKEGVLLLKHVPDKTIFEALHPVRFQPLTKEKQIVALLAKEERPITPRESAAKASVSLVTITDLGEAFVFRPPAGSTGTIHMELYELGKEMLVEFALPHCGEPVQVWLAYPINKEKPENYYLRYRFGPTEVATKWRLVGLAQMPKGGLSRPEKSQAAGLMPHGPVKDGLAAFLLCHRQQFKLGEPIPLSYGILNIGPGVETEDSIPPMVDALVQCVLNVL